MSNEMSEIPKWLKLTMAFIDRVGFPVMAFVMMFYMSYSSINKIDCTLNAVVQMLGEWQTSTGEFRKGTTDKMNNIQASIDRLHDKIIR